MYIERDSRKATLGKEQQSSNEYLSKCLDLLICHIVHEVPQILGKLTVYKHVIFFILSFLVKHFVIETYDKK